MKTKILVSYSQDDMDSWNEGRKVSFTIDTSVSLSDEGVSNMARAYLDGIGCTYREFMVRTEEVTEPASRVGQLYKVLSEADDLLEYKPFAKGTVVKMVVDDEIPIFKDKNGKLSQMFIEDLKIIEGARSNMDWLDVVEELEYLLAQGYDDSDPEVQECLDCLDEHL